MLGRYLWVLQLAAIAGCALLLGDAVAQAVDARLQVPPPMRPARPARARAAHATSVDRALFCSSCPMAVAVAPPRPSELHLGLVATLCPLGGGCTLALVRDLDDRSLRLYAVGDRLHDATITEIRSTRVALLRDGDPEYLDLLTGPAAAAAVEPFEPARSTPGVEAARDIHQLGVNSYEVPRATFDHLVERLDLVAESTRVVPEVRDGVPVGFRLARVAHDGPLGRLGLQSGDLVLAVNGLPLASAQGALDAFVKLRSASHLSLGLERNGRRLTKEVRIR